MTRRSSVALVVGALLGVWVIAYGAPSPPPPDPQRETRTPVQAPVSTVDLDREAAILHARLASPPPFRPPVRDPFSFVVEKPAPERRPAVVPPPVVDPPAAPVSDLPRLVAVLTDAADGGPVLRAVVAVGDDVQILRPGEVVLHYRVRSIGANNIELVDTVTGIATRVVVR